jgi:RNA polymerase sigma factor (sigma-70 family)
VQHGAPREVLVDEPREVADRTTVEQQVEAAEREVVLRHALEVLNPRERRLVELLLADPEVSYRQIGAALGMPIGSIGPTRQRCFGRLRRVPQLAALAQAA